jgi:hypothetical protein
VRGHVECWHRSSATISEGLAAKARAMAMRCFWPPESSFGLRRAKSAGSRTISRISRMRASILAWPLLMPNFLSEPRIETPAIADPFEIPDDVVGSKRATLAPLHVLLAARRTEASGGTIGGDFGLRGLAGALDLPRTAV